MEDDRRMEQCASQQAVAAPGLASGSPPNTSFMEPQTGGGVGPARPVDVVDSPWLLCPCTPGLAIRYDGIDGRVVVSDGVERKRPWPKRVDNHRSLILEAADGAGIPRAFLAGFAANESGGDETTRGSSTEIGLMQLLPSTARWLAGNDQMSEADIYDPLTNLELGAKLIRRNLDLHGGNVALAAASYNHGSVECGACKCYAKTCGEDKWSMITACGYVDGVIGMINSAIDNGYGGPIIIDLTTPSDEQIEVEKSSSTIASIAVGVGLGALGVLALRWWSKKR